MDDPAQRRYWSYFRLDGDAPTSEEGFFTIELHHGGRFVRKGNDRVYNGGEVVWVDRLDPDVFSWVCLNHFAEDLGYRSPPITYWYKTDEEYKQLGVEAHVSYMLQCLKPRTCVQLFIVATCKRQKELCENEILNNIHPPPVIHINYMGSHIEDLVEEEVVKVSAAMGTSEVSTGVGTSQGIDGVGTSQGVGGVGTKSEKRIKRCAGRIKCARSLPIKPIFKVKPKRVRPMAVRKVEEEQDFIEEGAKETDSDDTEIESLTDSDYEMSQSENEVEDDEAFQCNVDEEVAEENVHEPEANVMETGDEVVISDDGGHASETLQSASESGSDEDRTYWRFDGKKNRRKKKRFTNFREFNKEHDFTNPDFFVCKKYPNFEAFKDAMKCHSILTRKQILFRPNDMMRCKAVCKTMQVNDKKCTVQCTFQVWASIISKGSSEVAIKTCVLDHICGQLGQPKVNALNAPFIARRYMSRFMADPSWTRAGIQAAINDDFHIFVSFQLCHRAKKIAERLIYGSIQEQYNLLESWAAEVKKASTRNTVWIHAPLDGEVRRFSKMYVCYAALKQGWSEGCRSLIGLDGTHLRTKLKGIMLTAIGIDANSGVFPIAYAIVEQETTETWTWFLELLREDLQIVNDGAVTVMSDKQKGLMDAVKAVLPNSEHRNCVRHLYANFKTDGYVGKELKQMLWQAARSTTIPWFTHNMEEIAKKNPAAYNWLKQRPASQWSRSHFKTNLKCDILCNNLCESFNSNMLAARKLLILGLNEEMRMYLMVRQANRRKASEKWNKRIMGRVQKQLEKFAKFSGDYNVEESSNFKFQVQGKGSGCASGVSSVHVVNLQQRDCTCRKWNLNGLPCPHAIACIYARGLDIHNYVEGCYSKEAYCRAYAYEIEPIREIDLWEKISAPILPPMYKRGPGRPPNLTRTPSAGEVPPPPGSTKLSRAHFSNPRCGLCKQTGHNARTCAKRMANVSQNDIPSQTVVFDAMDIDNAIRMNEMNEENQIHVNASSQPPPTTEDLHVNALTVSSSQPPSSTPRNTRRGRGGRTGGRTRGSGRTSGSI